LVLRSTAVAVQLFARLKPHGNLPFAAQLDEFLNARTFRAFRKEDALDRPSCAQGFSDGMDSYQRGHYDKGTSSTRTVRRRRHLSSRRVSWRAAGFRVR